MEDSWPYQDSNSDPVVNQPVASHYTDYAILAQQLLSVHRVSEIRQMEIHTDEPLVPEPSPSAVEIAIANLKRV
jgi:hypothetical protein